MMRYFMNSLICDRVVVERGWSTHGRPEMAVVLETTVTAMDTPEVYTQFRSTAPHNTSTLLGTPKNVPQPSLLRTPAAPTMTRESLVLNNLKF